MKFTETGRTVFDRTYSRPKADGTKETWEEAVRRVVDGNLNLVDKKYWVEQERELLIEMMTEFEIIPAGRHLWASGVKGRQYLFNCHVAGWDPADIIEHFTFTFLRLAEGGGVGSNYSNRYLDHYPSVAGYQPDGQAKELPYEVHIVCDPSHPDYEKLKAEGLLSEEYHSEWAGAFQVEDTREGWADAMRDLIETYYRDAQHQKRVYDVSRIRWEGARLMSSGGHASGPVPLVRMLLDIAEVMNAKIGEKLDGMSAMRIDHAIAKAVVAGGNRRSARMSIMHWADPQIEEFIDCKRYGDNHWTTNISVEVDDDFFNGLAELDSEFAVPVLERIAKGMLVNGEPGFWNSSLSNIGEPNRVIATNPCVTSDTWVMTTEGARQVADLIGKPFTAIVDGKPYDTLSEGFFLTGRKPTVELVTRDGYSVTLTADHRVKTPDGWKPAGEMRPGDKVVLSDHEGIAAWAGSGTEGQGYLLGHLVGDGTFYPNGAAACAVWDNDGDAPVADFIEREIRSMGARSDFKGWNRSGNQRRIKTAELTRLAAEYGIVRGNKTVTPEVERASSDFYRGFLRGVFDTDGHIEGRSTDSGISIRLTWADLDGLRAVQRMLARLGIRSVIRDCHPEGRSSFEGYDSRASYRLIVSGANAARFMREIGFLDSRKAARWEDVARDMKRGFYHKPCVAVVDSVRPGEERPVYDVTVADVHAFDGNGIVLHNCGEIALMPWENCFDGDVQVITDDGPQKLRELVGKEVTVWHGGEWHRAVGNSFGVQPVSRFVFAPASRTTGDGWQRTRADYRRHVIATPDHRWDTFNRGLVSDLRPGDVIGSEAARHDFDKDGFIHGLVFGDGSKASENKYRVRLFGKKGQYSALFDHVTYPEKAGCPEGWVTSDQNLKELPKDLCSYGASFLDGWIAADGTQKPDGSVALSTTNADSVQWLEDNAASLGWVVRGIVKHDGPTNFGERNSPLYIVTLAREGVWVVESVEPLDEREVFCLTVPSAGRFTLGNGLSTRNCNLGHVNLAAFVDDNNQLDLDRLVLAHKLMTRFLIRATYGDVNDDKQAEVLAMNRRIGVGHLGVASALAMMGYKYSEVPQGWWFQGTLDSLYQAVRSAAREYARQLRIPEPVKVTTVAPTGTIAKMPGVSEGIHPIFSKYFIRRIRFSNVDPEEVAMVEQYREQGYHVEPCKYAPNTTVVAIPTKDWLVEEVARRHGEEVAEEIVQSAADLTLEDMLAFQAMYQTHWADNAVSFTVNVDPEKYTIDQVQDALIAWGPLLKGATVFPEMSMDQAPYERISKADYELYEFTLRQVADGVDEDCATGACPVK